MTDEEVQKEREETRAMLANPCHRYHETLVGWQWAYQHVDEQTRDFMRKIAPYAFEEDGSPLMPLPTPPQRQEPT